MPRFFRLAVSVPAAIVATAACLPSYETAAPDAGGAASGGAAGAGGAGADVADGPGTPDGAAGGGAGVEAGNEAGADAGEAADAKNDATDGAACPPGFGFSKSQVDWPMTEGNPGLQTKLDLALSTGGEAPADCLVEASGAPSWLVVPSKPDSTTSLTLYPVAAVPWDADAATTFDVTLRLKANPACKSTVTVAPQVQNHLHHESIAGSGSDIAAAAYQPVKKRFVLLSVATTTLWLVDPDKPGGIDKTTLPVEVATTGKLHPTVGATDTQIVVLAGTTVWRLDPDGKTVKDSVDVGGDNSTGRTLVSAGGWTIVGDLNGGTAVLKDGAKAKETTTTLPANVRRAKSLGASFAMLTGSAQPFSVWRFDATTLPSPTLGTPCGTMVASSRLAVGVQTVALFEDGAQPFLRSWQYANGCDTQLPFVSLKSDQGLGAIAVSGKRLFAVYPVAGKYVFQAHLHDIGSAAEVGIPTDEFSGAPEVIDAVAGDARWALLVIANPIWVRL